MTEIVRKENTEMIQYRMKLENTYILYYLLCSVSTGDLTKIISQIWHSEVPQL